MRINRFNGIILSLIVPTCIYLVARGFTLATVLILFGALLTIIYARQSFKKSVRVDLFLFISILSLGLISLALNCMEDWYNIELYIHNQFNICITFLAILIIKPHIDIKYFINSSLILGVLASILCFYQSISIFTTGHFVANFYLPFFEVVRDADTISGHRPCAFFTEPAHLCMFLAPLSYFLLSHKKYLCATVFFCAMLFSLSTSGLLFCVVLPLLFLFSNKKAITSTVIITAIIFIVYSIIKVDYPEVLELNLEKLDKTDASSDMRLFGPLLYLRYYDFSQITFGIGLNQLEDFVLFKRGSLAFEGSGNYANSIIYMFLCYGFVGSIILLYYLYFKYKFNKKCFPYFILLLCILCSDQILFSTTLIYLLCFVDNSFALYCDNNEKNKLLCFLK